MAEKAGVAKPVVREPIARTAAMLNAALRAWEAKQAHYRYARSAWARRSEGAPHNGATVGAG